MAYVPGDEIPAGSLGDEFRGFSLKKIGKTISKAVKDTGKGIAKGAKVVAKVAAPVVKIAAPIAAVAATGIVGGIVGKKVVSAVGGAIKNKKAASAAKAAIKVAVPAIPAATGTGVLAQIVNATAPTEAVSIDPRTGRRTVTKPKPTVQSVTGKVLSASAKARDEVTKRQQQARDTARRLRQVAEIAKGTPAEGAANRAAQVAENIANQAQVATNVVRQASAGVDGAIVGAGSAVAAETAQQEAGEFFRSKAGLATIGAGVLGLVLLTSRRK